MANHGSQRPETYHLLVEGFYASSIPLQVLFYASPLNQKHEFHFSEILALEVKSNLPSLIKETKTVLKI